MRQFYVKHRILACGKKIETCTFAVVSCISKTYLISSFALFFSIQTQTPHSIGRVLFLLPGLKFVLYSKYRHIHIMRLCIMKVFFLFIYLFNAFVFIYFLCSLLILCILKIKKVSFLFYNFTV